MTKKILYINHSGEIAGAEKSILTLIDNIDKSKFNIYFTCPENGELVNEIKKRGLKFIPLKSIQFRKTDNPVLLLYYFINLIIVSKKLDDIVKRVRPDIIHCNSIRSGILTCLKKKDKSIKILIHIRDRLGGGLYNLIIHNLFKRVNCLISISEYLKEEFCKNKLQLLRKTVVVYNPVDYNLINDIKMSKTFIKEYKLRNDSPLIALIGYIAPLKGHHIFLKAAELVARDFKNAKFFIIGNVLFRNKNKSYLRKLKRYAENSPYLKNRVIFTGYIENIYGIIKAVDLVVQPSLYEGWGRVVAEALLCGKPVIAANVGGIPEILTDELSILMFRRNDCLDLYKKMSNVLGNYDKFQKLVMTKIPLLSKMLSIGKSIKKITDLYLQ